MHLQLTNVCFSILHVLELQEISGQIMDNKPDLTLTS